MLRREIGELLDPSALGSVPDVSLAALKSTKRCFFWHQVITHDLSIGGPASKQTSNGECGLQGTILEELQDAG